MSVTDPARYRLTIVDQREERLNTSPTASGVYDFDSKDGAELLAQFLLQRRVEAPGEWRDTLAGGTRHVTIVDTEAATQ